MRAWHQGTLSELLVRDPAVIAAELAAAAASRRLAPNPESLSSWIASAAMLKDAAAELALLNESSRGWHYYLEFEVPRRGRRIDAAILAHDLIFLLEWKIGAPSVQRGDLWQAEQYALDMRDFHEGSRDRLIVPLLIASRAASSARATPFEPDRLVQDVRAVVPDDLAHVLHEAWAHTRDAGGEPIDARAWEASDYRPTPGIVDAARLLYDGHDVRNISVSGAQNLDATVEAVLDLIDVCRRERRRGIAFITGAPGSGKTLAGLQVVHTPEVLGDSEATGAFLSGNAPLVEVISAALATSGTRGGRSRRHTTREVRTFIQHAYAFRNNYAENPERVPPEHVVLFDEAQRAWDGLQVQRWTRGLSTRSEPQILLDVMSRVPDWAVVIALVGSGQEINRGEAGLSEWGRALEQHHADWLVRASAAVLPGMPEPPGGRLFEEFPGDAPAVTVDTRLHLQMNVRSPRAERLNQWVDHLLSMNIDDARRAFPDPREYPMVMTRDLDSARAWLRDHAEAEHRMGLLASAEARRLRAWGIDTKVLRQDKSWADWFLRDRGDVRGSDQLEVAATNFDCQGLEIDWAGVCWGNDLVPSETHPPWRIRRFLGSRWTKANEERSRFTLNGYRVILTRARRGQIIWVPRPDRQDETLNPEDFDLIAGLLAEVGVPSID